MVTARLRGRQKYFSPRTGRIISAEGRVDFVSITLLSSDIAPAPGARSLVALLWLDPSLFFARSSGS